MAYEVTATRRRPQEFEQIVGQDFVVATLTRAIEQGRIAHAYLFAGPRGVGKTSAARILAKALNCERGPTPRPCGTCSPCREIAAGASLDVIEIDGASNTSVNDVREIKDEVLFAPNSSRYKIYIIDEVHMLSNSAFNALLKTIEEPPPYVVFVFATTEIHRVPATIRSRCQQFNFRLISTEELKRSLAAACNEMGIEAEESALLWIAKEATGSLRDAYTLLDQVISLASGPISLALIHEKLGVTGLDQLNELAEAFLREDGRRALEVLDSALERGVAAEQFVVDLAEYFRSLLLLKQGVTREGILGYPAESFPKEAVEQLAQTQLERAIELLLDVHRSLRTSLNQRFELELAVSRLARIRRFLSPEDLLLQIRRIRSEILREGAAGGEPGAQAAASAHTAATARPSGADRAPRVSAGAGDGLEEDEDLAEGADEDSEEAEGAGTAQRLEEAPKSGGDEKTRRVLEVLRRRKPAVASAMDKAERVELEGGRLRLTYRAAERYSIQLVGSEKQALESLAAEVLGEPIRVEIASVEEARSASSAEDEKIELVKRVFKGRLIEGG